MSYKKPTKESKMLFDALFKEGVDTKIEYWDKHKHVDICLPTAKIYIEVDGLHHLTDPNQIARDFIRDHYSDNDGFDTLRIPNQIVVEHLNKVVKAIKKVVENRNNSENAVG